MLLSYTAVRKHDSDKLEFVGLGYTDSSQYMCLFRSHQPVRLPLNPQRNDAATLQRIASAISGNSGNPLQPEPPRIAAAHATPRRQVGVRGKRLFAFPPAAFRRFRRAKAASLLQARPALENPHIPQADKSPWIKQLKTHCSLSPLPPCGNSFPPYRVEKPAESRYNIGRSR